jgi:hypothetical protein
MMERLTEVWAKEQAPPGNAGEMLGETSKSRDRKSDLQKLLEDAHELLEATTRQAEEKVRRIRHRQQR